MIKSNAVLKNPREVIFFILNDYFKDHCNLKALISSYLNNSKLSDINKNFVYNISKGVIRNYLSIDYYIAFFSKIALNKLDPEILNTLRLGVFQAIFLNRIPDYSIVNECVEIAKKFCRPGSSGFINAVLRKITALNEAKRSFIKKINQIEDPINKISIKYSFPEWIVKYWISQFGEETTFQICRSLNKNPSIYFQINTLKTNKESIYKELNSEGYLDRKKYFGSKSFRINPDCGNLLKSDLLRTGLIYIQDLSSQIAVRYFLEPKEKEKILDVCSAPGGKALHSAIIMNNTGKIVAVDNSTERITLIWDNIEKMNIENIEIVAADATNKMFLSPLLLKTKSAGFNKSGVSDLKFDKIFIDAPCSALGTASKNPDAKYNKKFEDIEHLKNNSLKILQNCDEYLKIGGKIVFYTCTLSRLENIEVIEKFLALYKNKYKISIIDIEKIFDDIAPEHKKEYKLEPDGYFEIMPYYFNSEGATVCSIIKIS